MPTLAIRPKAGDLSVWWIPQVPGKAFRVPVKDVEQAKFMLQVLEEYDLFQLQNRIKPDYCNIGGLDVWEDGEWLTWYDEDGKEINEL